jgi:hypothetical protein
MNASKSLTATCPFYPAAKKPQGRRDNYFERRHMPQNYRYAEYHFLGLVFGVIELPNGDVVTTNMALAAALGVNPGTLREAHSAHPQSFRPLSVSTADGKEILEMIRRHRAAFMTRRVRQDLLLWTEADMYMHCRYSQSPRADQFMRHNVEFLRDWRRANVHLDGVSDERFARLEELCERLEARNNELQGRLDKVERLPSLDGTASLKFTVN